MAPADVVTRVAPEPQFALVGRVGYVPVAAQDAIASFQEAALPAPAGSGAMGIWFEDARSGVALKWHIPAGALFDACHGGGESMVPWEITVHFTKFPREKLLRCDDIEAIRRNFMNELKQAAHLRHGTAKVVMALPKADQEALWEAVMNRQYKKFSAINGQLHGPACKVEPRKLCIRLVELKKGEIRCTQRIIIPSGKDDSPILLGDALRETFGCFAGRNRALLHGIAAPLHAPVQDVFNGLSSADNFLYIVQVSSTEHDEQHD